MFRRSLVLSFAILLLLAACSEHSDPTLSIPVALAVVSGNGQTGMPGEELADPLVVRVEDAKGRGVSGQIVNFRVVQGGGTVFAGAAITNKDGIARERWTLGASGAQRVEARAVDPETGAALTFAVFNATIAQLPVTVTRAGNGAGTVTSSPTGISCGEACSTTFTAGTTVTLTAAPEPFSTFTGWSGACTGTASCVLTMDGAKSVTATFVRQTFALTVTRTGNGTGTVSSNPAGIDCGLDCSESYDGGTVVTLTATPAPGSTFTGWSGACVGTGACVVTMSAARSVSAGFTIPTLVLSVLRSGTGTGTVTSTPSGINCVPSPFPCNASFPAGTTVTLTATPSAGSTFTGWSGTGCTGTGTCVVTMSAPATVTATFTRIFHGLSVDLTGTGSGTVTSSPAGISCAPTCLATFASGTVVTLTATPATGSTFVGWIGVACSGTGPCAVTMDGAKSVTAAFSIQTLPLTVTRSGAGSGTVTSAPAGIDCGPTCGAGFDFGTVVSLAAAPSAGSTFAGWSGACTGTGSCVVTMSAARSVTATFNPVTHPLTVTLAGSGSGAVTSNPAGISCGGDCAESYTAGTTVVLTATPATGSIFTSWTGCGVVSGTTCTVTMNAATSVSASFTRVFTVTAVANPAAGGVVQVASATPGATCTGAGSTSSCTIPQGGTASFSASAAAGYRFDSWSGASLPPTPSATLLNVSSNVTAAAQFVPQFTLTVTLEGGLGVVTSSPGGISCGADCSQSYDVGTTVILTATGLGSTFVGWSGIPGCLGTGPCVVGMTASRSVTATFSTP